VRSRSEAKCMLHLVHSDREEVILRRCGIAGRDAALVGNEEAVCKVPLDRGMRRRKERSVNKLHMNAP